MSALPQHGAAATMSAAPTALAVTIPMLSTVAMFGWREVHTIRASDRTSPSPSYALAANCTFEPSASSVSAEGEISTRATREDGEVVMVTCALPLFPSLAAVIVALPGATPVTSPLAETVAMSVSELDQVTGRPSRTLPPASLTSAVSWIVVPAGMLACAGDTLTEPTGVGLTVTLTEAALLPALAVIVALPAATPRTTPEPSTETTSRSEELHEMLAPSIAWPFASIAVAASWAVEPTVMVTGFGSIVTAAGRWATATVTVSAAPVVDATICASPFARAVARPLSSTETMLGASDFQAITASPTTFPLPSRATALRRSVSPSASSVPRSGSIARVATADWTMTETVSETAPARAMICVIPIPTPRTTPSSLTAATDGSSEDHSTLGSTTSLPFRSRATAAKRSESPTPSIVATASPGGGLPPGSTPSGMTNRDVTFCCTVIVAVSEREETDTSISAVPGRTATTFPFRSTVAISGFRLRHESGALGTGTPSTDTSAEMRTVSPSASNVAARGESAIWTDSGSESMRSWYSQAPRTNRPSKTRPALEFSHRIRQPLGTDQTTSTARRNRGRDPVRWRPGRRGGCDHPL